MQCFGHAGAALSVRLRQSPAGGGKPPFRVSAAKITRRSDSDDDQRPVEPTLPPPLPVVAPALLVALVPLPRSARAEAVLPGSTVGFSPAFVVTGEAWVPVSPAVSAPLPHAAVNTRASAATVTAIRMMFLRGMR
jgi:hypothetical protein